MEYQPGTKGPRVGFVPRRCEHPKSKRATKMIANEPEPVWAVVCECGHVVDEAKRKKGFRVQRLAKEIERWVGKQLHLTRVGQYGGQEDLGAADDWAFAQVKSGSGWFSEKQYREIAALPLQAGKQRFLVTVDKPGSGRPRRALVIYIMDEIDIPDGY